MDVVIYKEILLNAIKELEEDFKIAQSNQEREYINNEITKIRKELEFVERDLGYE